LILTKLDIDKITKLIDERYVVIPKVVIPKFNFWVIAITLLCEKWHITGYARCGDQPIKIKS